MAQNSIELPEELFNALRRQAAMQKKSPDRLVAEWVSAHLDVERMNEGNEMIAFEKEIAAFQQLKPTLLRQYAGQYVAILHGEVVASGRSKLDVSRRVREKYGPGGYYVELVAPAAPRSVRMVSPRVVRG